MKSSWNNHEIGSPPQMIFSFTERTIIFGACHPATTLLSNHLTFCLQKDLGTQINAGWEHVQFPYWRLMCEWFGWCATTVTGKRCGECCWGRWFCFQPWVGGQVSLKLDLQALKLSRPTRSIAVSAIQPLKVSKYKLLLSVYVEDIIVSGSRCFHFFKHRQWWSSIGNMHKISKTHEAHSSPRGLVKFPNRKSSTRPHRTLLIEQLSDHIGVSKHRGTPKWMVYIIENPIKMDDLEVPLFSETSI